ncbi:hypothetical protein IWW45_003646 [Coemansia sp. RSA 485]|nr:hypothetical protein IWW45_003646 [Coemansia sp. RSA 485]
MHQTRDSSINTHFCSSCKKRIPFEAFQRRQNGNLYNTCMACLTRTKQRKGHGQQRATTAQRVITPSINGSGSTECIRRNTAGNDTRNQQSTRTSTPSVAATAAVVPVPRATSIPGSNDEPNRTTETIHNTETIRSVLEDPATARRLITNGFPYGSMASDLDRIATYDASTLLPTLPANIPLLTAARQSSHLAGFPSGSQSPIRQPPAISAASSLTLPTQTAANGTQRRHITDIDSADVQPTKRRRSETTTVSRPGLSIDCAGASRETPDAQSPTSSNGPMSFDLYVQLEYQRLELERQRLALDQERWREERMERQRWEQMYREQWQEEREQRKVFREREQHMWKILLSLKSFPE